MARRYELTDRQHELLADLLPAAGQRGGRWNDHRTTLNGSFWWLYWICFAFADQRQCSTLSTTAHVILPRF